MDGGGIGSNVSEGNLKVYSSLVKEWVRNGWGIGSKISELGKSSKEYQRGMNSLCTTGWRLADQIKNAARSALPGQRTVALSNEIE